MGLLFEVGHEGKEAGLSLLHVLSGTVFFRGVLFCAGPFSF
jgi:hypothetical protein